MQGNNANRWRAIVGTRPTVYEHVQDSRYTLHKHGYGPPKQGTLVLCFNGQAIADCQTMSMALVTRMAHMGNLAKSKRRKSRRAHRSRYCA